MKFCKNCLINHPIENFGVDKQTRDGLLSRCKSCMSQYKKELRSTPEAKKANKLYAIRKRYKLTPEQYYELISRNCDSCGSDVGLAIDHDHNCCPDRITCGNCIRGVLCRRCNTAEGMFKNDPNAILKLVSYMQKHRIIHGK